MNNATRFLAVGLSAAMLTGALAGCGNTAEDAVKKGTADVPADACETLFGVPADTVVATVNGENVTMADAAYWLCADASNLTYYFGDLTSIDWTEEFSEGVTIGQYILNDAVSTAISYKLVDQQFNELGLTLSEEAQTAVDDAMDNYINSFGENAWSTAVSDETITEDDFTDEQKTQWIREQGEIDMAKRTALFGVNAETLRRMEVVNQEYMAIQDYYFGENGENYPTDEVLTDYVNDYPYYCAKSILFRNLTDADGNEVTFSDMTDEQKAELKAKAQTVLDDILASEDPEAALDAYQESDNDDPGSSTAGSTYVFSTGEMVESYENAVAALSENEISSELVEDQSDSPYGYFIVMRKPVDFDSTPISGSNSIRDTYVSETMYAKLTQWNDSAETSIEDIYTNLDLSVYAANSAELNAKLYPETVEEDDTTETASTESASTESASAESEAAESASPSAEQ